MRWADSNIILVAPCGFRRTKRPCTLASVPFVAIERQENRRQSNRKSYRQIRRKKA
jgi:hypothetical protein